MDPLSPSDPLARELSAALRVDPSPDFVARVRVRIDADARQPASALWRWKPALAALAACGLLVTIAGTWMSRPTVIPADTAVRALLPHQDRGAWLALGSTLDAQPARLAPVSVQARIDRPLDEVQIPAAESAALRRLFAGLDVAVPEPPARDMEIPRLWIAPLDVDVNKEGAPK